MLYGDDPWPEQPEDHTTEVFQEIILYEEKIHSIYMDDFRMPRERIELLTASIPVAAARLRTETARCEDQHSVVIPFPAASSHINPTPTVQEREGPMEIAQDQPLSSTASSPSQVLKVVY